MKNIFPPKKILVAMDHSPASLVAWDQAKSLAKRFHSEITALHVRPLDQVIGLAAGSAIWVASSDSPASSAIEKHIGKGHRLLELVGDPVRSIIDGAAQRGFDLIVMGTHGRTGLKRTFLGSIAEAVVRRSSVPVFIARGAKRPVNSVLVPVNFTPHSYLGVALGARAAAALGARLKVISVVHPPPVAIDLNWTLNRLQDIIDALPKAVRKACRPSVEVLFGTPAGEIIKAAAKHGWVVLAAHRRGSLRDALIGTTAEQVLRLAEVPVLTAPDQPARSSDGEKFERAISRPEKSRLASALS